MKANPDDRPSRKPPRYWGDDLVLWGICVIGLALAGALVWLTLYS